MRAKCGLIRTFLIVYASAYSSLPFVNGQDSQEMIEQGRVQYQLLKERINLPQHGTCCKSVLSRMDEGCKQLSEGIQSDLALHITNCFLAMSGHETYNCEQDKKLSLRGICINNMSDRAFNVYTEFYIHTQNICWFLRGQTWHDILSTNTLKASKQLELSSAKQEQLLEEHNKTDYSTFTQQYIQDLNSCIPIRIKELHLPLKVLTSWIETMIFFYGMIGVIMGCTCIERTSGSRLLLLSIFAVNFWTEILICTVIHIPINFTITHFLYNNNYLLRCGTTLIGLVFLVNEYFYSVVQNARTNSIKDIHTQSEEINDLLLELIDPTESRTFDKVRFVNELNNIQTRKKVIKTRHKQNNFDANKIKNTILNTIQDSVKRITKKGETPNSF